MAAESYGEFNASLLYCNKCGRAMPVRQRLLLVLPEGDLYDYTCQGVTVRLALKQKRRERLRQG